VFKFPFVILDLETSGIDPKSSDIIEVALIRYENGKEVARYDDLIKVNYALPEIITAITGITDADIREKGKDKEAVFAEVRKLIQGAYMVGHNINFDFGFLKEHGVKPDILGLIDTIPLSQILIPNATSYSLESLTVDLGISHENRHRAMGDVEATLDLFKYLFKEAGSLPKEILSEIKELIERSDWTGGIAFQEVKPVASKAKVGAVAPPRLQNDTDGASGLKRALSVDEVFGDDGVLAKVMEGYKPRSQQIEMTEAVYSAFDQGYHLVCEAPTGVGKSLAYLAAAANIAISNKSKVVISTNTVNLQQQLFGKDVPMLKSLYKEATGNEGVRVALLKGRSHYLCLRRLSEFKRRSRFSVEELVLLIKILVWQRKEQSDETLDIYLTQRENLIWDFELSADQKYCTPIKCRPYGECYLHRAREKAENADIVIVNHALLCADLESGGILLPEYQYLVVDEAHHFEEVATKSLGLEIKQENIAIPIKSIQSHLVDLKRRFSGTLFTASHAFESVDSILDSIPDIQQAVDNFFNVLSLFVSRNVPDSGYVESLLVDSIITATQEWLNLNESLDGVHKKIILWQSELKKLATAMELSEGGDFPDQIQFTDELMQEIAILSDQFLHLNKFFEDRADHKEWIRWVSADLNGVVTVHLAPMLVGPHLSEKLYNTKKSIIFTSATLGVKLTQEGMDEIEQHPFTYVRRMLGLNEKFEELILDTPFNYESQAYVIIPTDLQPVQSSGHMSQISGFMKHLIKLVGGGLLGLFTSHSALESVYLSLVKEIPAKDTKILAQRISGGRAKIMKAYMANPQHSALLGTSSFWEGVDIQGDALTTLVIHKIPFDVPSDPVLKVRGQMFSNSFMEYSIPRAILRFRQGFGRMIRSVTDYGVMIVLDDRLLKKEYGQMFLQALPEGVTIEKMPLNEVPDRVHEWLELQKDQSTSH